MMIYCLFFFKQKPAYEMRISDCSSNVCSSYLLTVARIGRDRVLRFRADDWVTVTDDHRELMGEPGEMARIVDTDEAALTVTLDRALPTGGGRAFGANPTELMERHPRVQRWAPNASNPTIHADGRLDLAPGPIRIEDGVHASYSRDPPPAPL